MNHAPTFMGLKIIESPLIPRQASYYKLAPGDYIGEEFRARMQAWCDEFFGIYAPFYVVSGPRASRLPERGSFAGALGGQVKDFYEKVYEQDNPKGEAHGWVQWKGTNVCMDVHCACGALGHIDADFAYFLRCAHCGRVYATGCNVKLIPLTPEQVAYVTSGATCEPIEFRDDDLDPPEGTSTGTSK